LHTAKINSDHEESLNKKLLDLEDNKARRHAELISKTASADTKENVSQINTALELTYL
jgi:hypothetical protein